MHQLGAFFASLREAGTRLSIITKGNVGACRYLLEQEGLLQFFEQVFGMLGQFYGESDFDRANQESSPLEGSSDCELRESKANLIRSLMSRESLSAEEACLVEDDPQEISSVKGICLSVFVSARRGMTATEMEELRRLSGAKVPEQSAAAKIPAARTASPQAVAPEAKPQTPPPPPVDGLCGPMQLLQGLEEVAVTSPCLDTGQQRITALRLLCGLEPSDFHESPVQDSKSQGKSAKPSSSCHEAGGAFCVGHRLRSLVARRKRQAQLRGQLPPLPLADMQLQAAVASWDF